MRKTIPLSVNKLTVEEYVKYTKALTERESNFAIIRSLMGLTQDQIDEMPLRKLKNLVLRIEYLRASKLRTRRKRIIRLGCKFYFAYSDLNANRFTALDTYKFPEQIAEICCIGYVRGELTNARMEKLSKEFSKKKMGDVYGQVFFCTRYSELLKINLKLSSHLAKMKIKNHMMEVSQTLEVSDEIMDGIM